MANPAVRKAYDAQAPEFELARIESGRGTPSMRTVQRFASAVGARAVVRMEPLTAGKAEQNQVLRMTRARRKLLLLVGDSSTLCPRLKLSLVALRMFSRLSRAFFTEDFWRPFVSSCRLGRSRAGQHHGDLAPLCFEAVLGSKTYCRST